MARRPRQLDLPRTATWGGARKGAGRRPPTNRRTMVQHRPRPEHRAAFPVHVTLRARRGLPSLRLERTFAAVRASIARASSARFRVLHFSAQTDHIHLLVEADDSRALSIGVAALKIRVARAINRNLRRSGAVWAERYHARALRTPREMRAGRHRPSRTSPSSRQEASSRLSDGVGAA